MSNSKINREHLKSIRSRARSILRQVERLELTDLNYDTHLYNIEEAVKWINLKVIQINQEMKVVQSGSFKVESSL